MKERVTWLDVLKYIGIVEIYFGHYLSAIGAARGFVFTHHVHLFFFAAGCSEYISKERKLIENAKNKATNLLIPFYLFSILSIFVFMLDTNANNIHKVLPYIKILMLGNIRDRFIASSLWFITAAFSVSIMFSIIKRIKNNWLILGLCTGVFLYCTMIMEVAPPGNPRFFYNIDNGMYYLLFYAIGYVSYPHIQKLLTEETLKSRITLGITGTAAMVYSLLIYFGKNVLHIFNMGGGYSISNI